jgi:arabinogalactan endo-1,4-beta-galactosidase
VNPPGTQGQVNTLAYTLAMARRAKHAGLSILLDLHYSDGWADGHGQTIPSAWKGLTQTQLCDRVRTYTFQTLKTFDRAGCMPNMVALGNEITNGILWPAGGPMTTDKKWPALLQLLSSASAGVRQASPRGRTQIMIHLNCGGNFTISDWFFDHCRSAHLDYDVMGLSYYPFWSGDLGHLRSNLTNLSLKYGRQIVVAETGYPFRGKQGSLPFPATPSGQKAYLEKLMQIVSQTPGGRGRGVFYWEPAWIESSKWNGPKWSTQWEDRALFDEQGNALPAIAALRFEPIRPSGSLAGLER